MVRQLYALSTLFVALSSCILGFFVFSKGYKNKINRAWFYFCLSVGLWSLGYYLTQLPDVSKSFALVASRFSHASGAVIPAFFLRFVFLWFNIEFKTKNGYKLLCYATCSLLCVFSLTSFVVTDVTRKLFFEYYPVGKIGYLLYVINFVYWVVFTHYFIFREYIASSGGKKNQIKYLLFGTIPGFVGGSACFPLIFGIPIPPYITSFILIYIFTTTYAMVQYRLMGIKFAIKKIMFPIATVVVLGVIIGFGCMLHPNIGKRSYDFVEVILIMFLGCTLAGLFYKIFSKIIDRFFPQKNYSELLYEFGRKLGECRSNEEVFNCTIDILKNPDSPRSKSAVILWQESSANSYNIQSYFGIIPQETYRLSIYSDLVKILKKELRDTQEKMGQRCILIKDELQKIYDKNELGEVIPEFNALFAQLCVPLFYQQKWGFYVLLGVVFIGESESRDVYNQEDYEFFLELAEEIGKTLINIKARYVMETEKSKRLTYLGRMALGWGNKVKNILNVISTSVYAMSEYMKMGFDKDKMTNKEKEVFNEVVSLCDQAYDYAHKGEKIANSFLRFTKPIEKEDFKKVSVREIILSAIDDIKKNGKFEGIKLYNDIPNDLPNIDGIEDLLKEAFFNVLDNAVDSIRDCKNKSDGFVRVKAGFDKSNRILEIEIEDSGSGIKQEDLDNFGTPLFMPDSCMSSSPKGEGMGIATVYYYVQNLHRGRVNIESELNRGTKFYIVLPVEQKF